MENNQRNIKTHTWKLTSKIFKKNTHKNFKNNMEANQQERKKHTWKLIRKIEKINTWK